MMTKRKESKKSKTDNSKVLQSAPPQVENGGRDYRRSEVIKRMLATAKRAENLNRDAR